MLITRRWLSLAVFAVATTPVRAADLSKYLPEDTEIVVGINVTTLVESDLVQKHVPTLVKRYGPDLVKLFAENSGKKIDEDVLKEFNKFLGDTDLVKNWLNANKNGVKRMLIATTADFDDSNAFMVFEGDFNKEKMKQMIDFVGSTKVLDIAVKPVKEGKYEFYSVKMPGEEDELYVGLADDQNVLCCEDKKMMAKALGRVDAKETAVRKELTDVASKIDAKAALWMAAAPKEEDEYVAAHGYVIVTNGIKVVAAVTAKDADKAKDMLSDMKDGIKELGNELEEATKQYAPLAPLRELLKKVEPKLEKNVVTVEGEVPGPTIDKVIKDLPGAK
jgi:hypothetical protein